MLLHHNPVDWSSLNLYGKMRNMSGMMLRNLVSYLEVSGYAVGFGVPVDVKGSKVPVLKTMWCGCRGPCLLPIRGCPKRYLKPAQVQTSKSTRVDFSWTRVVLIKDVT